MSKPNQTAGNQTEDDKSDPLVNIDIPPAQIGLGKLDLFLQFIVRLGDVVEGQDRHAQPAEKVASEGYQGVERELLSREAKSC